MDRGPLRRFEFAVALVAAHKAPPLRIESGLAVELLGSAADRVVAAYLLRQDLHSRFDLCDPRGFNAFLIWLLGFGRKEGFEPELVLTPNGLRALKALEGGSYTGPFKLLNWEVLFAQSTLSEQDFDLTSEPERATLKRNIIEQGIYRHHLLQYLQNEDLRLLFLPRTLHGVQLTTHLANVVSFRPDLQAAFVTEDQLDLERLIDWYRHHGVQEFSEQALFQQAQLVVLNKMNASPTPHETAPSGSAKYA